VSSTRPTRPTTRHGSVSAMSISLGLDETPKTHDPGRAVDNRSC
jgi:hypothetical protein